MVRYSTVLILGLLFWSACQTESDEAAEQESKAIIEAVRSDNKVKTYKGNITGKYPIEVQLVAFENNRIQGFYLYRKAEILLPIKGVRKEDNRVELAAYDETGGTVELFIGKIQGDSIVGEWFDKREGATTTANFSMILSAEELSQADILAFKGTYEYEINGYKSYVVLEPIGSKTVKIQALTVFGSCTGEINGEAYIHDSNHINYFGEDNCFINIYFDNNEASIREMSCSYYHGFKCSFDGTYTKVSEALNWIISG